jgi:hypothetical protein
MRPKLLSMRPTVTRASRRDPRGAKLESVAAEFALLAQRRARIARQIDLLARQLDAASGSLAGVQSRMGVLADRIRQIDPGLAPPALDSPGWALPAPAPAAISRAQAPLLPVRFVAPAPAALPAYAAAPSRAPEPATAQGRVTPRPMRHLPRRRPFQPE